jgi:hypothetical protein
VIFVALLVFARLVRASTHLNRDEAMASGLLNLGR